MRILVLTIIFFSAYTFFFSKSESIPESDAVKVQQGAPERKATLPSVTIKPKKKLLNESEVADPIEDDDPDSSEDGDYYEGANVAAVEEDSEVEHVDEGQKVDHEKSWQDELSQVIATLEPRYGEEMFNAYVSERHSYEASLNEFINNNQNNPDLEYILSEIEARHEEKVKDIFGRHYEEIKYHQSNFLRSQEP